MSASGGLISAMPSKKIVGRIFVALLSVALLLLISITALIYHVWMPVVPPDKAAQICAGIQKEDVRALLGDPRVVRDSETGEIWYYSKPLRWASFSVRFSHDGKVVSFEDDR